MKNVSARLAVFLSVALSYTVAAQMPVISIFSVNSAREPSTAGSFRVFSDRPVSSALVVPYTIAGSAVNGTDYSAIGTSVTLAVSSTEISIPIQPINDSLIEGNELVTLTLQPGSGYSISNNAASVSILDKPAVTVTATDSSSAEPGSDTGVFTITRTGATSAALTVYFATSGTATSGTDFQSLPTSATIPSGSASTTVVVTPLTDSIAESTETVVLSLGANISYNVGSPSSATVNLSDAPVVTVLATDSSASELGPDNGYFTVTRTGSTVSGLTVYFTAGGTATSGTDYTSIGTSVTIPSGSASVPVYVSPFSDASVESTETVVLNLSTGAGYNRGSPLSATVNIADAPVVTLSATDSSASEPGSDTGYLTVSRSGSTASALAVNFTVGGTATSGADYSAIGTSVTIPAGSASAPIYVYPVSDTVAESTETVIVTVASGSGYVYGSPGSGTVNIADAPVVSVVATDASASELGPDSGYFTVSRTGSTASGLTVYFTAGGTATSGTDYTSIGTSVTIPSGSASVPVYVSPFSDASVESTETVVLNLSTGAGYNRGSPLSATVNIADAPVVTLSATDSSASEPGSDTGYLTVSRSGSTASALAVNFTVGGTATSGADYSAIGTSVTIPAGSASAPIYVYPVSDTVAESTETVIVTVASGSGYVYGSPGSGTVNIADAPVVSVVATDASASELGPDSGYFTVSRTGSTASGLTVYFTAGGTATSGADYTSIGTSVTIPAGSGSVPVYVSPFSDASVESTETVVLNLSTGAGYNRGSPLSATVNIADAPVVTLTATDSSASEPGSDTGYLTVSRSGSTASALAVNFTVGGTATSGADYSAIGTSVTIPAGSASAPIYVYPVSDTVAESTETVIVTVASGSGYVYGSPGSGTVNIADAPVVSVVATDASASELGPDSGYFTVSRTGSTASGLTVYFTAGGTATSGTDYTSIGTSVTIPAGSGSVPVYVSPFSDASAESTETVVLNLSTGAGYNRGSPLSATVNIADAPVVTLSATDSSASEPGSDTGYLTVSRSGSTASALAVNFTVGGTATSGADYSAIGTSVTIPAGSASAPIYVYPVSDTVAESTETVIVTVASGSGYVYGSPGSGTVNIADAPVVSVVATDASASELGPDSGYFTVSRTGSTASGLTIYFTAGGTATSGADYTSIGTSVTIPAGSGSVPVYVSPFSDASVESTETVVLNLSTGAGYNRGSPLSATVNIADAPVVTLTATDSSASEPGSDTGYLTVSRSGSTASALAVNFTVGGTATSGADYSAIGTSVTIPAGSASAPIYVYPVSDTVAESTETVIVTVASGSGYVSGSPVSGTVNIADAPVVSVVATDASAGELGPDTGYFTVSRTGSTASGLAVYFTAGGTASSGADYTSIGTSVTIPAGSASAPVYVTPLADASIEATETVVLNLSTGAGYNRGSPLSATVNIADAPVVTLTATDSSASEPGSDTGYFTVSRSGSTASALAVNFTVGGTATSGADYSAIGTSVTIPAGSASAPIYVYPVSDTVAESTETVIVTVASGSGYVSGSPGSGTVNIADAPVVSVVATDASAGELGPDTGYFTVSRTGSTASGLAVYFTAGGTASSGADYTSIGTSVTIPAGSASAPVYVTPLADASIEATETVVLNLSTSSGYNRGSPLTATVNIADAPNDMWTGGDASNVSSPASPTPTLLPSTISGTGTLTAGDVDHYRIPVGLGSFVKVIAQVTGGASTLAIFGPDFAQQKSIAMSGGSTTIVGYANANGYFYVRLSWSGSGTANYSLSIQRGDPLTMDSSWLPALGLTPIAPPQPIQPEQWVWDSIYNPDGSVRPDVTVISRPVGPGLSLDVSPGSAELYYVKPPGADVYEFDSWTVQPATAEMSYGDGQAGSENSFSGDGTGATVSYTVKLFEIEKEFLSVELSVSGDEVTLEVALSWDDLTTTFSTEGVEVSYDIIDDAKIEKDLQIIAWGIPFVVHGELGLEATVSGSYSSPVQPGMPPGYAFQAEATASGAASVGLGVSNPVLALHAGVEGALDLLSLALNIGANPGLQSPYRGQYELRYMDAELRLYALAELLQMIPNLGVQAKLSYTIVDLPPAVGMTQSLISGHQFHYNPPLP
jgi:hypothetical protein